MDRREEAEVSLSPTFREIPSISGRLGTGLPFFSVDSAAGPQHVLRAFGTKNH